MATEAIATVHLRAGHVQPLFTGHPWVFSQAIARIEGAPAAGDEVLVRDPKGNALGRGFYSPTSAIPVRVLTRDVNRALDAGFFRERIAEALRLRAELLGLPDEETTGYRLVHAEGDGLAGLLVDRYGDVLCAQLLTAGMKRREAMIFDVLREVTGARAIVEVASPRHQKLEGFAVEERTVRGEPVRALTVRERGFTWEITAPGAQGAGGQKTGYFFDQRESRALVETLARGRRVLDLYSYVGGFALAAARGGAREVLAIDSSEAAIQCGITAAKRASLEARVRFHRDDARRALAALSSDEGLALEGSAVKGPFELVVLDPPKLAPGVRDVDEARGHYRKLNAAAARVVAKGGLLLTCSCSQAMGAGELLRAVAAGARDAGREAVLLRSLGQPPDHPAPAAFPEGRYLKVLLVLLR